MAQTIQRDDTQVGEGVSTAILLYTMLFSMTGSIATANWSDDLSMLTFAAAGGVTLGILFAKIRRLPGALAHFLMFLVMVPVIATLTTTILPEELTFLEKLVVLQERIQTWVIRVASGGTGSDAMIFVIQLSLMAWVFGYLAAWYIYRRHQVWGAILPTGLALVLNLFYALPQSGLYLGLFIVSALLLLIRLNLQSMEQQWRSAAIGYSSDISFDFLWYGGVIAVVLIFLVWLIPASPPESAWLDIFDPLQAPWQGLEDNFNRAFNTLRAVARPSSTTFFGTTLIMGGPVTLGQNPVMDIQADNGRYWRATVYDKYTGIGWINTHIDVVNLGANDSRIGETREYYRVPVTQTVSMYVNDQNVLYAQSEPLRFDIPVEVRYAPPAQDRFDVAVIRARRPLREGTNYTVVSNLSVADEDSLRNDSISYSYYISATYLQLPVSLPERVRSLAKQITEPYSNPYDKAAALEKYVKNKIAYNDQVTAPPTDRDGVDYTLFDRSEGYCNYYASVMAVMARTVGIPARVASGYSLGEYANGVFHIVEANAHSWVEVYFPNYGWIEFEPTSNKPDINRPTKPEPAPDNPDLAHAASEARRRQQRDKTPEDSVGSIPKGGFTFDLTSWENPRTLTILGGGLLSMLCVSLLTIILVRQRRRDARISSAGRVYEKMLNRARWLGIREQKYATPLERAQLISRVLPAVQLQAEQIALSYTSERFGARALDEADRSALTNTWNTWRVEWWRAMALQQRDRLLRPLRALAQFFRGIMRRWERME